MHPDLQANGQMSGTARQVQLMDTTLRDGEQTQGVSYSPVEKVNLAKALLELLTVDRTQNFLFSYRHVTSLRGKRLEY